MFNYFDSTGATYWVGTRGFRVSPSRLGCLTKCSRLSGILCATLLSDALAGISSTNSFSDSFSTSWADVWDQSCMVKHWYVDFHQYWVSTITGLYKYKWRVYLRAVLSTVNSPMRWRYEKNKSNLLKLLRGPLDAESRGIHESGLRIDRKLR